MMFSTEQMQPTDIPSTDSTIEATLAERAKEYFDCFRDGPVEVRLVSNVERVYSSLREYALLQGTFEHRVMVKWPTKSRSAAQKSSVASSENHPRLHPRAPTEQKAAWEFGALRAIEAEICSGDATRFRAMRALDLLSPMGPLVLEKVSGTRLRELIHGRSRWHHRKNDIDLSQLCHSAGKWLKAFHALPPGEWVVWRDMRRDDYVEGLARITHLLAETTGRRAYIHRVRDSLVDDLQAQMSDPLATVVLHGDFAPRNVLVGEDQRITVFDTLAGINGSPFVDLAQFCVALRTASVQAVTCGLWHSRSQIERLESALLRGYFGEQAIPRGVVDIFIRLLVLERWGAVVQRRRDARGLQRVMRAARVALCGLNFRQSLLVDVRK